ncbi:Receptor-like protein 1 [Camellia lanceoleosa]|uniref:Receptor-like protein 1 n=1 Tax=Camellia lanceoleosa TaxID=1840588 RepID=A0ACC0FB53_9ERIC|nr:Receptor-like protein 1 [Camellia lanceoleosa]
MKAQFQKYFLPLHSYKLAPALLLAAHRDKAIGIPGIGHPVDIFPIISELLTTLGRISAGILSISNVDLSQSSVFRSINIVRDEFETSVTCKPLLTPPVKFQINQEFIVPNRASSFSNFLYKIQNIKVNGHSAGCLEGERRGLLEFKEFLKSNGADADHLLPTTLSALRKLETLNLEWNKFDDSILPSLSALRSLKMLNLRANKIGGLFPAHELAYFGNLERLDLSENQLNGIQVPMCTGSKCVYGRLLSLIFRIKTFFLLNPKLGSVELVHLRGNKFTRLIPRALFNSSNLLTFDIRENRFSGSIPDSIGVVSNLRILLLRRNQLSGSIPTQLCQLNRISLMDFSHNYFNGSIPCCFGTIAFGMIEASLQGFMQMTAPLFNWHTFYKYRGFLERNFNIPHKNTLFASAMADEVEFVTKSRTYSYGIGSILNFMQREKRAPSRGREGERKETEEGSISPYREREWRVPAVEERRPEDTSEISIAVGLVNLPSAVGGGEVGGLVAMESLLRKREKVEIGCSGGETQRQKR